MNLRIALLLAVAAVVGLSWILSQSDLQAVFSSATSAEEAPTDATETNSNDERSVVTSLGRLEPASRIVALSGLSGSRLDELQVGENQQVERGDVVAILDEHPIRKAALENASAELKEAKALLKAETENGEALITEARVQLRQVNELLQHDLTVQRAIVQQLEIDAGKAERDLQRSKKLLPTNAVTDEDMDAAEVAVLRLQQQSAEANSTLVRIQVAAELDRALAEAKITSAQTAMRRAQLALNIDSLATKVTMAEAELERTIIRAPVDGTILKIHTFPGEQIDSDPILTMGSTHQMYAVAEVYETDARFVRSGQRATITSPALAGPVLGTVDQVGHIISKNDVLDIDPAAPVDARVIEVRIRLEESDSVAPFNNLQVRVEIQTKQQD